MRHGLALSGRSRYTLCYTARLNFGTQPHSQYNPRPGVTSHPLSRYEPATTKGTALPPPNYVQYHSLDGAQVQPLLQNCRQLVGKRFRLMVPDDDPIPFTITGYMYTLDGDVCRVLYEESHDTVEHTVNEIGDMLPHCQIAIA